MTTMKTYITVFFNDYNNDTFVTMLDISQISMGPKWNGFKITLRLAV